MLIVADRRASYLSSRAGERILLASHANYFVRGAPAFHLLYPCVLALCRDRKDAVRRADTAEAAARAAATSAEEDLSQERAGRAQAESELQAELAKAAARLTSVEAELDDARGAAAYWQSMAVA